MTRQVSPTVLCGICCSPSTLACSPVLCQDTQLKILQNMFAVFSPLHLAWAFPSFVLQGPAQKIMFFIRASLQCSIELDSLFSEPPKHLAVAPRFWLLDYFSALFLSSPTSSTLCSAYCLHSHPVLLIINFLRAGVCLINFYVISSTWHRPRPLWALKLNRILAMNCSSRPDFVSENCSGFRGQFSDIPSLENSIFHCHQ